MKHLKTTLLAALTGLCTVIAANASAQQMWKIPTGKYHPNGKPKAVWIREGKKLKKSKTTGYAAYYATGELKRETKIQGNGTFIAKSYYKSGQLGKIGVSKDAMGISRIGQWKTFHANGQLMETVFFEDTYSKEGEYKEYYDTGVLKTVGQFGKVSARLGVWTFYDAEGNVESTEDYGNGKYVLIKRNTDPEAEYFSLL